MKTVLTLSIVLAITGMMILGGCKSQAKDNAPPDNASTTASAIVVVNARCPIMGNNIEPAKLNDSLTRVYKGQKVGFCCGMCPPQWDKLTDEEKDKKLQAAGKAGT